MKITVFTRNQPRHLSFLRLLAGTGCSVRAIIEVNTIFPGSVPDFYPDSPAIRDYMSLVIKAERDVFGSPGFTAAGIQTFPVFPGDINRLKQEEVEGIFDSDIFLVFGASWIRGWLANALIERSAVNIHMGLSPFYRGSSCNFWAVYDHNPQYVGATVHYLSKGLDSGDILFHTRPNYSGQSPFLFTMEAVRVVQDAIVAEIEHGSLLLRQPVKHDSSRLIRYSKNSEFTEDVASEFLKAVNDSWHLPLSRAEVNPRGLVMR